MLSKHAHYAMLPGKLNVLCLLPPLQLGGFEDAKRGLADGRFRPEQFKVLTRYAGVPLLLHLHHRCCRCCHGCCGAEQDWVLMRYAGALFSGIWRLLLFSWARLGVESRFEVPTLCRHPQAARCGCLEMCLEMGLA